MTNPTRGGGGQRSRPKLEGACRVCRRTVGLVVPRGGDGSMRRPRQHKDRLTREWCSGAQQAAEGWD